MVDKRMTYYAGPHAPILILIYDQNHITYKAGSSPIPIDIEKNLYKIVI